MKLLKRTLALTLSAAMVLGLLSGCGSDVSANVLNVYNWGEYIDTDLLDRFEQETGIKVIYNTFDSNENLYSRIQTTSYEVIIPSDYAISRLCTSAIRSTPPTRTSCAKRLTLSSPENRYIRASGWIRY